MANIIDSLLITLGLDGSGVSRGMDEVENRLSSGVNNIVTNVLAPLAGALAFNSLFEHYINTADALGKLSRELRTGVQDVQAWGDAVESSGGDAKTLQSTLSGLEQKLKDAQRGVGAADFRALGVNVKDANGNLKSSVDILSDLSRVADTMNPDTFERLTKKLGIDAGTLRLLQSGSKEVDSLVSKYKDLAYTQKDAKIASEYNDAMSDLTKTIHSAAAILMRVFVPALSVAADRLRKTVNFIRKHETFVVSFFTILAAVIAVKLTPAIWGMARAWLANPMTWIIVGVALLAAAFDDLWHFVNRGGSAMEALMRTFGASEETIEATRAGAKALIDVMIRYGPALGIVAVALKGVTLAIRLMGVAALSNPVLAILFAIAAAATYIITNWDKISAWWKNLWADLKETFSEWIADLLSIMPGWLKKMLGIDGETLELSPEIKATLDKGGVRPEFEDIAGGYAAMAVSHASIGRMPTTTETYNTNMGGVTFDIKSTDPVAAGREAESRMRTLVSTRNTGVNQKGGR